jgi:hypothetical protein
MEFNFNQYLKNNPLLKESSGYGNYTRRENMLEIEGSDSTNPWMEDVDGTDAYTMGEWKCYYDYPGYLVWSYGDKSFDELAVYATPNFDTDGKTPIQVDVDNATVDNQSLKVGTFSSFQEYASAMKPVLDAIEKKYTNGAMQEDQDPYTYQSAEEFDLEPQDGPNDPLGPDEELMEGDGKVLEVYQLCLDAMRSAIKKYGLDDDDVQELRVKLAEFFK